MPGCPDDERWVELIEGRLHEAERSQLEAHLDGCERCSEIVALAVGATGSAPHTMGQPGIPRAIGRYPILRVLGRGAMGVVFEGSDPALQRRVAIKLLQPRFIEAASEGDGTIAASDAPHAVVRSRGAEMRLLREARSLARFNHPGIVEIYEVGIGAEGPFIVMELVPGTTLRIWCDAERRWFEIVRMFVQAARALAAAHEAGIVHRDFKPDNAIVADDGRLKVLDFGLARAAEPAASEHATTRAGAIVGTPVYLAPECLTGRPADARSDQFSFFVSLYEALAGHRPFQARNVHGLAAQTRAGPSTAMLGELVVPGWLRAAIARGLSPRPDDRFADMHAVVAVLERGARRGGRRGRFIAAAIGSTLLVGGVVWAASGEAPCTGGRDRIAPAWSVAKRDEVAHAFATAEAAWAEPLGPRVLADLDAYAGAWVDAHAQACRAAEDLDRRMRCLALRLDALRAATDLLASGDEPALERAPELTSALPSIDACADPQALDTAAIDAGVELQRGRLAKADVVRLAGDFAEAERIAASVLASEDASRSDRLRAEALVVHGKTLFDAAKLEDAAAAFESAFFLAERIDASAVALDAASHNALVSSWYLRQPERGEAWLRHASAAARRIELSPQQCYELEARTALVYDAATRNEEALVHHRAALQCLDGVHNDPARARTRMNMGMTLAALGRGDEGLVELRAALDLFARTFGDAHPETLGARVNLGSHLSNVGQLDEALRLFADARERIDGATSVAPALELAVYINSGVAASRAGRHEEAVVRLQEAVAFAVRVHGAEHSETFEPRLNYGVALEDAGRFEEALAVQRALRADMDASPEHPPTLVPVLDLNEAVLLRKLGRLDEALTLAHDARLAWTAAHDTEDERDAWLEIARILSAMGRENEAEALLQSVQLTE